MGLGEAAGTCRAYGKFSRAGIVDLEIPVYAFSYAAGLRMHLVVDTSRVPATRTVGLTAPAAIAGGTSRCVVQ